MFEIAEFVALFCGSLSRVCTRSGLIGLGEALSEKLGRQYLNV